MLSEQRLSAVETTEWWRIGYQTTPHITSTKLDNGRDHRGGAAKCRKSIKPTNAAPVHRMVITENVNDCGSV